MTWISWFHHLSWACAFILSSWKLCNCILADITTLSMNAFMLLMIAIVQVGSWIVLGWTHGMHQWEHLTVQCTVGLHLQLPGLLHAKGVVCMYCSCSTHKICGEHSITSFGGFVHVVVGSHQLRLGNGMPCYGMLQPCSQSSGTDWGKGLCLVFVLGEWFPFLLFVVRLDWWHCALCVHLLGLVLGFGCFSFREKAVWWVPLKQ